LKAERRNRPDFILLMLALVLTSFGILMIFSAGGPYAKSTFNDMFYFVKDQVFYTLAGLVVLFLASFANYRWYKALAYPILGGSFILLILTYVPGISVSYNDARRWINIGIEFQPSEIYKVALIIFLAKIIIDFKKKNKPLIGYIVCVSAVMLSALTIFLQPHLSAAIIIVLVGFVVIYVGGAKIQYLLLTVVPVLALGVLGVAKYGYMSDRIVSWQDPFNYQLEGGYQVVQSLYAIASGGLFGVGLGKSTQKFLYIPEPQNDFIFSIIAEELGYIGVLIIVALFGLLLWRGIRIAILAEDLFGALLATGISSLIFIQMLLNISVVTGLIPNTGITLPFFSYGGTSLIMLLGQIGILLNISKYRVKNKELDL